MARNDTMCSFCGRKGARVKRITQSYGRGVGEFLIRNIPMVSCPHCGENYLTAATLHELERIKTDHRKLAVKRRVDVAIFPNALRRRTA